jgi:glucosamine--fructose-6-phosphate aminotransferase (isomerizing)
MDAFAADCALALEVVARLPQPWTALAEAFAAGPVLLLGEGSSRLVPGGLARRLAREWGLAGFAQCSGRQLPVDWSGTLLAVSNSGRTRELIEALTGRSYLALTGLSDGPLSAGAAACCAVLPRPEGAVAATASVLGQALVVAEALAAASDRALDRAALRQALASLAEPQAPAFTGRLWVVGADDGVAEELALKAWETAGLPAVPVAAGLALHGLEEVLEADDLVWLVEVDPRDRGAIQARLATTGAQIHEQALPDCGPLTPLLRLAAGWRVLAAWARARGRDPACPRRARKIGNDIHGVPA